MKLLTALLIASVSCVLCLPAGHSDGTEFKYQEELNEQEGIIRSYYEKNGLVTDDRMLGFSWSNCATGSDLTINKLTIAPDPIVIPGNVTVSLDAKIATDVKEITSAVLVVKKKIFGVYIEIPCVDNVGSCTFNDICAMAANITCPKQLIDMGFSCHCPFKANDYEIPDGTVLPLPDLPIPPSVENGDYDIQVTLMNGSTKLACYDFKASLKKA